MKQLSHHVGWLLPSLLAVSLLTAPQAVAQAYPSGLVRIVIGGPAGSPPDIITRIVANELGQAQNWKIIVENRPGAIQTIAAGDVLKQAADGYSIYAISLPAAAAPALLPNLSFRLDTDFAPVIKLMTAHQVLVVNPSVPAKSLKELVAVLKAQPDKMTFSSGGFGTPAHLMGEMFRLKTGGRVAHVPYRRLPEAITDLVNGTNHYQFITSLPVVDLIEAGKLRALAVTAPKRLPSLKHVPTVVEEGFPELLVQDWVGLMVKRGTPDEVVALLNRAINKALGTPGLREAFEKIAAEPAGGSPSEFGDFLKTQVAHWSAVVKDSGIKMRE